MPRYRVVERRCYDATYIIEAADGDAAGELNGEIVEEEETDSWGYDLLSVEAVDDNEEL